MTSSPQKSEASVLPNDWLECIGRHRTLEVTAHELAATRQRFDRAQSLHDDFGRQRHTRLIALRGNDLLVAVGPHIRVLDLDAAKDCWIQIAPELLDAGKTASDSNWLLDVPYKALYTPDIDFDIEALVPNMSGNLLAVVGRQRLAVVSLPRHGFVSPPNGVPCKTWILGNRCFTPENTILKTLWHPLSETRTHILVLTTDSILRMFDVSESVDEPEQSFDLCPTQRKASNATQRGGISLVDELDSDEEVVTFTVGGNSQNDSGWEPFNIYYALRNGHIYALSPVIPYKSRVRWNHLDALMFVVDAKTQGLIGKMEENHEETDEAYYFLLRLQSQWLSEVLEAAQDHREKNPKTLDTEMATIHIRGGLIPFPVQRQGPFRCEENVAFDPDRQVADILFLRSHPLKALILAFTDGSVRNYILETDVDPQWKMPRDATHWQRQLLNFLAMTDVLPRATLYERIQLPEAGSFSTLLVADPLYSETYYVYSASGVHQVSLAELVKKMTKLDKLYTSQPDEEAFLDAMDELMMAEQKSEVQCLLSSETYNADQPEPVLGIAIVTDIYLTYSLLALTRSYKLVATELSVRHEHTKPAATVSHTKRRTEGPALKYEAFSGKAAYSVPDALNAAPLKFAVSADLGGNKPIVINENTLRFIVSTSQKPLEALTKLMGIASALEQRISVQEQELERQIDTASKLARTLENTVSAKAVKEQDERILQLARRHGKISLRIDSFLRKSMQIHQPELSEDEKKWVERMNELQEKVEGPNGYVARIEKLKEQLQRTKSAPARSTAQRTHGLMTSAQSKTLLQQLTDKKRALQEIKQRVEVLQNCLP